MRERSLFGLRVLRGLASVLSRRPVAERPGWPTVYCTVLYCTAVVLVSLSKKARKKERLINRPLLEYNTDNISIPVLGIWSSERPYTVPAKL
jgi:hypothetical protein